MSIVINEAYEIKQKQIEDVIRDLSSIKDKLFQMTLNEINSYKFEKISLLDEFFSQDFTGEWAWLKCSVIFYFYKGKTIIHFFNSDISRSEKTFETLIKKYDMKNFSYQNNADPEKGKSWKTKEKFWKEFSNDVGETFQDKGIIYRLISNDDILKLKKSTDLYKKHLESKNYKFSIKSVLRDFFKGLREIYG